MYSPPPPPEGWRYATASRSHSVRNRLAPSKISKMLLLLGINSRVFRIGITSRVSKNTVDYSSAAAAASSPNPPPPFFGFAAGPLREVNTYSHGFLILSFTLPLTHLLRPVDARGPSVRVLGPLASVCE